MYFLKLCSYLMLAVLLPASAFSQTMPVPVNLGQDTAVCLNESLLLDATFPDATYLWSTGATSPTITVNSFPGTFSVTVTDTTGAYTPGSDTISVTDLNIPPVSITPSGTVSVCNGDSVLLAGSFGGTSIWYRNGIPIPGPHTNEYWASLPGSYNMTKTNQNGCTDSSTVATLVEMGPPPTAAWSANKDTVDLSQSGEVIFSDSSIHATSWQWDFGDGNTSMDQDPVHMYTLAGNYMVMQIVQNDACQDTAWGEMVVQGMVARDPYGNKAVELVVFPNPTTRLLNVQVVGTGNYHFALYSLMGEEVYRQVMASGQVRIDLGELPRGIYSYQLSKKQAVLLSRKLVLD